MINKIKKYLEREIDCVFSNTNNNIWNTMEMNIFSSISFLPIKKFEIKFLDEEYKLSQHWLYIKNDITMIFILSGKYYKFENTEIYLG